MTVSEDHVWTGKITPNGKLDGEKEGSVTKGGGRCRCYERQRPGKRKQNHKRVFCCVIFFIVRDNSRPTGNTEIEGSVL
jgi:hypothetical protein